MLKPNTDLHNGDKIRFFFFSDSTCYHQVSSIMLNHHSINNLKSTLTLTLFSVLFNTQILTL